MVTNATQYTRLVFWLKLMLGLSAILLFFTIFIFSYYRDVNTSFKLITEDQIYGREILKEIKKSFIDINIKMLNSDSIKNDFNLIRSSKLAILSNSTFSWWASFLSTSKKEFIVPKNFSIKEKRIILPNETILN